MRFARASGSKASNERMPNDATPWHIMKEQLIESQAKNEKPTERVKSAKELLKEREDQYPATDRNQNNWAEFEEVKAKKAKKEETQLPKKEKKLRDKKGKGVEISENVDQNPVNMKNNEGVLQTAKAKKKKPFVAPIEAEIAHSKQQSVGNERSEESTIQKKKAKKRNNNKAVPGETIEQGNTIERENEENGTVPSKKRKESKGKAGEGANAIKEALTKRQKRNLKRKNKNSEENSAEERNGNNEEPKPFPQKLDKDFSNRQFNNGFNGDYKKFDQFPPKKIPRNNHATPGKVRDDQEHARRKPETGPLKLIINGVEVELVKYDGFPVKREDAERLKDLRQQMVMKGIPKKDIDAAMKLERRRAEKALARIRREVCYHCRKAGHILSDCPELGVEQAGTGICFKCGSTEHTHFECKVAKATEYRFAKCFICREQGHIAKQCPDNPKGVYPQGGACKVCGDVTHLKKDCPDLIKEKEETALTLDTITDDTLESLDNEKKKTTDVSEETRRKKKVIKF